MRTLWAISLVAALGCGTATPPGSDGGNESGGAPADAGLDAIGPDGGGAALLGYRCGVYGLQPSCEECEQLTGGTNTKPCLYCGDAGMIGLCTSPSASCFVAKPADVDWCYCGANRDPSTCPLAADGCLQLADGVSSACVTCGSIETNGLACRDGGTCSSSTESCN